MGRGKWSPDPLRPCWILRTRRRSREGLPRGKPADDIPVARRNGRQGAALEESVPLAGGSPIKRRGRQQMRVQPSPHRPANPQLGTSRERLQLVGERWAFRGRANGAHDGQGADRATESS